MFGDASPSLTVTTTSGSNILYRDQESLKCQIFPSFCTFITWEYEIPFTKTWPDYRYLLLDTLVVPPLYNRPRPANPV